MKPRVIGKGLTEKRQRLVRLLEGHARYLGLMEGLRPWTPPTRAPFPPRQVPSFHQRWTPAYVSPRERPELAHRCPGPEALSDDEVKAWVAEDIFVRSGLRPATQRAMAFIATFAPQHRTVSLVEDAP